MVTTRRPLPRNVSAPQLTKIWPFTPEYMRMLGLEVSQGGDDSIRPHNLYNISSLVELLTLNLLSKQDVYTALEDAWNGGLAFVRSADMQKVFNISESTLKRSNWPYIRLNLEGSQRRFLYSDCLARLAPLAASEGLDAQVLFSRLRKGERKLGSPNDLIGVLNRSETYVRQLIRSGEIVSIQLPGSEGTMLHHCRVLLPV